VSLRDHLRAIRDEHGKLTPALVVDTARSEDHPLHASFEWNDEIAGEAYRRVQAHDLIQSVRISYRPVATGEHRSIRAFHAVRGDDGYVYEDAEAIVADPFLTRLVLQDMAREWKAMKARYDTFREFWQLVAADIEAKAS
jgi:hypothetical protein